MLEKTKWVPERKRPTIAYKAPRGFEEVKLKGKGATYGLLKGCRSLKLKDIRGLINKAAAAGPGGGGGGEDEAEGGDEEAEGAVDEASPPRFRKALGDSRERANHRRR